MPRKKKCRLIGQLPEATYFKPRGVPLSSLSAVELSLDEFEALRLADLEGLDQLEAAGLMGVSRATFGRILERAHRNVAEALVRGKAIAIQGGPHCLPDSPCKGETHENCCRQP